MQPGAAQRYLRQIALPEVGPEGQERLAAATVATVAVPGQTGGDLGTEIAARYLAAAGVGTVRVIGQASPAPDVLLSSNPDLNVQSLPWPGGDDAGPSPADPDADGRAWVKALDGADLVVRSGFDDDPMLRATVRLGIPVVLLRALEDRAEVLAVRRQGPCPHVDLAIPRRRAEGVFDGPAAVIAGTLAASEALLMLIGPTAPAGAQRARARHLAVPLDGGDPRAQDIPWTPECFACGGGATEMVFS